MNTRRLLPAAAFALVATRALAADKVHRVALQISDDAPEKMNAVLNVAANTALLRRYRAGKRDSHRRLQRRAQHARTDRSPVLRLKSISEGLPNVGFEACANTRENMARSEGKKPEEIPIYADARTVPSGVVSLIELSEKGWTIVRP
jgi:intracellular sulfur oxidation DsrE/DsrF family protein